MEEPESERELVEHIIEIDEYASAVLKIPVRLTAIDLKALMHKANKLFNLAEVPLVPNRGKYTRIKSMDEETKKKLVLEYDNASYGEKERIAERLGIGIKALYAKVWGVKRDLGIQTSVSGLGYKKYSDELVKKAVTLLKTKSTKEVSSILKMEGKNLYDLIKSRTGKTIGDLRK